MVASIELTQLIELRCGNPHLFYSGNTKVSDEIEFSTCKEEVKNPNSIRLLHIPNQWFTNWPTMPTYVAMLEGTYYA